jgi:hypothetical protein
MSSTPEPNRNWHTTDEEEILRRRERARQEEFEIANLEPRYAVFSNFQVKSAVSGHTYQVEIRNPRDGHFSCSCPDFRISGLGTCKHVEAVRLHLEQSVERAWQQALKQGWGRIDIVPDRVAGTLRIESGREHLPRDTRLLFDDLDLLRGFTPEEALEKLRAEDPPGLRISQEVGPWLEELHLARQKVALRRDYEEKVRTGDWPAQETPRPLRNHERQGMLHLAFNQRAVLADEFCLNKPVQALAAAALLHRLGEVQRMVIVVPRGLLKVWRDLIRQMLPKARLLENPAPEKAREQQLACLLLSYERLIGEAETVRNQFQPHLLVLDEAQRMRNWTSPSALAVKRITSRFAFVLADTDFEKRLDEVYAVMDFLSPDIFGPLFRFNRNFYVLNKQGRPVGVKNLEALRARLRPTLLRREKREVETELPEQRAQIYLCPMDAPSHQHYLSTARDKDAHTPELAAENLSRACNGASPEEPNPPGAMPDKLRELRAVLPQLLTGEDHVAIFAAFEPGLLKARELCEDLQWPYAWLGSSGSGRSRDAQITKFRADPECRLLLALDTTAATAGLRARNCSYLVHLDLPLTRAALEDRVTAVWRRDVCPPLTHVVLTASGTIEEVAARHLRAALARPGSGKDNRAGWPNLPQLLEAAGTRAGSSREISKTQPLQALCNDLARSARHDLRLQLTRLVLLKAAREPGVLLMGLDARNAPKVAFQEPQRWADEWLDHSRQSTPENRAGELPSRVIVLEHSAAKSLLTQLRSTKDAPLEPRELPIPPED